MQRKIAPGDGQTTVKGGESPKNDKDSWLTDWVAVKGNGGAHTWRGSIRQAELYGSSSPLWEGILEVQVFFSSFFFASCLMYKSYCGSTFRFAVAF